MAEHPILPVVCIRGLFVDRVDRNKTEKVINQLKPQATYKFFSNKFTQSKLKKGNC